MNSAKDGVILLIAGVSGAGKSTLVLNLQKKAKKNSNIRCVETSTVLKTASRNKKLPKEMREGIINAMSKGDYFPEEEVAKLVLADCKNHKNIILSGMRGAKALQYFHTQRPIAAVITLKVDRNIALARMAQQEQREDSGSERVRNNRYKKSKSKLSEATRDAKALGIPVVEIRASGSEKEVAREVVKQIHEKLGLELFV
ncbi:MAG: AAA family ATPase [Pseudomonadales bacterium]|nr:AAA family ATPase [Pseudomonadales bacterium]